MRDRKTPYHHGNLRQAVVDSAWKTIQADGIEKLSLRGCAREIGVDPAAIYQHFKSKRAILEEIARIGFVQLADRMELEEAAAGPDPRARLVAVGCAYVAFARANPQLFELIFKLSGEATSGATTGLSSKGRDPFQILTDAWAHFAGPGPQDTVSPLTLWSAAHGIADLLNKGFGPTDEAHITALVEEVCNSMLDGREVRAMGEGDAPST